MEIVELNKIKIGNSLPLVLIAGPCVVENRNLIFHTADRIKTICNKLKIDFIFKSSYKKANRTSGTSFIGLGDSEALTILDEAKKEFNISILTDVHTTEEIDLAKEVADVLQIPAFLSRQTELLLAAGASGKIVNIKKGQFLAPEDMKFAAEKVYLTNNKKVLLTERGTSFGYHNLVVDMRSLVIMKNLGCPVIMDATHSVQIPSKGGFSGGERNFILPLAKAATSIGIAGLFIETHPNPEKALSDSGSQLPLNELEEFLKQIIKIDNFIKNQEN